MKVREGVFSFGTGLDFEHGFLLQVSGFGFGGSKIPFSFFVTCGGKASSGAVIRGTSSFCFTRNDDYYAYQCVAIVS
jgi:hypothetical protein